MARYKIINNLLTYSEQDILESAILNENTQWIFNRFSAYKSATHNISDEMKRKINSFRHPVFMNGIMYDQKLFDLFKIIPIRLGAKNVYNMISQLQIVTENTENNSTKHIDMPDHPTPYFSTVYYINKSDGPTVLYNTDGSEMIRSEHERGKVIMFDGNIFHHSSKPKTDIRCIMNFCWD